MPYERFFLGGGGGLQFVKVWGGLRASYVAIESRLLPDKCLHHQECEQQSNKEQDLGADCIARYESWQHTDEKVADQVGDSISICLSN